MVLTTGGCKPGSERKVLIGQGGTRILLLPPLLGEALGEAFPRAEKMMNVTAMRWMRVEYISEKRNPKLAMLELREGPILSET